jgi:threonine aldolase
MNSKIIDLRSDTVTQPSREMLEAMFAAKVGDDVFGDDPTVNELEKKCADLFGMEAALFCPSGTMSNQIAINIHTKPGDEIICDKVAHIYYYEGGGIMRNSGASVCLISGDRGRIKANDVIENINPDDIHRPVTRMVEVENTVTKGGGAYYNFNDIIEIADVCRKNGLKFHLDGARLFNALVETNNKPIEYGQVFDSISICLSKGLGCPIGSVLIGKKDFIKQARRVRKALGGGMRQAGFLAAAGIYALDNNINRLKEDHKNAKHLGNILNCVNYVEKIEPIDTNIILFSLNGKYSPNDFAEKLKQNNILAMPAGKQVIRMVTHLNFTNEMLMKTEDVLKKLSL